jgi:3-phenylpropionate/trans-cinnamate dioxygenase ferredoxin subunit
MRRVWNEPRIRCPLSQVEPGSAVKVVLRGVPVAVVRCDDGSVHAIGDTCTHADVSLSEGEVQDRTIEACSTPPP